MAKSGAAARPPPHSAALHAGYEARRDQHDLLRRRTEAAASYIDLDRLAISPQCGFASSAAGNPLGAADERAKLRLVVDAARAIWG
jgi:5-methyltetrahydropteroyltriglutamate--homocysteine methyltransferase